MWLDLIACATQPSAPPPEAEPEAEKSEPRKPQLGKDPTPTRVRPEGAEALPTRELSLVVEVVKVEGRMIRVASPQGELVLPVRAKAFESGAPEPRSQVRLRVGIADDCGEYQVLGFTKIKGLPVRFGKVLTSERDGLLLETPSGNEQLAVNAWSDLDAEVRVGAWVGARVYSFEDRPTVLSARAYPGDVWDLGTLVKEEDGAFVVDGMAGRRCWKGSASAFSIGDLMEVRGSWDPQDGFRVRGYTPKVWPQPFVGRIESRDSGTVTLADADLQAFGTLSFVEPRLCDAACEALTVGDLVETDWRVDGERRVMETLRPKASPRYERGEVVSRTDDRLILRPKRGEEHEVPLTPETVLATPVAPGDTIYVVRASPGVGPALVLIRE